MVRRGFESSRFVWPRQISAKSPQISARLCELAFSQKRNFPSYVDAILPLVVPMEQDLASFPILRREEGNVIDEHPEKALSLLHAALAEDVRKWPYGAGDILERIAKAAPSLKIDQRLVGLTKMGCKIVGGAPKTRRCSKSKALRYVRNRQVRWIA